MRLIFPGRLTALEKERLQDCRKKFGKKGFVYEIVDWTSFGYNIVYSSKFLWKCPDSLDIDTMEDITDYDARIETF